MSTPLRTQRVRLGLDAPGGSELERRNHRLEARIWAGFLLLSGVVLLLPAASLPSGTWPFGAGLLLLALNLVRWMQRIPVSPFTITLGALAVSWGVQDYLGLSLPLFALALVACGGLVLLQARR